MMFKVLRAGIQTTFQDLGRWGFRDRGVPLSGTMDSPLAAFANALVGNNEEKTVVEFTFIGPIIEVLETVETAICGRGLQVLADHQQLPVNQKIILHKGQQVNIRIGTGSVRGYLAVPGGFDVPKILGSSSYYKGFTIPEIEKGSVLKPLYNQSESNHLDKVPFDFMGYKSQSIQVTKGPEFELLSERMKQELIKTTFTVHSQSNRMAIIFKQSLTCGLKEIITAPVQPGTIQLFPTGKLAVLMRDAQATGGYARILQLETQALHKLSQKPPGSEIHFKLV